MIEKFTFHTAMIIDDSPMDNRLINQLIQKLNFAEETVSFNNPAEAYIYMENILLHKAPHKLPDIIFLDLHMPEISGFQFLDLLNKFPERIIRPVKIIITSSSEAKEDIEKSAEYSNVIKYIFKPVKTIDLEEVIEKVSQ